MEMVISTAAYDPKLTSNQKLRLLFTPIWATDHFEFDSNWPGKPCMCLSPWSALGRTSAVCSSVRPAVHLPSSAVRLSAVLLWTKVDVSLQPKIFVLPPHHFYTCKRLKRANLGLSCLPSETSADMFHSGAGRLQQTFVDFTIATFLPTRVWWHSGSPKTKSQK